MKTRLLFLLSVLIMASCGSKSVKKIDEREVYLDNSEVITSTCKVNISDTECFSRDDYYVFNFYLSIKNLTDRTRKFNYKKSHLTREYNGAAYKSVCLSTLYDYIEIESQMSERLFFSSSIPTHVDEGYYLTINFDDFRYKVFLYDTPELLNTLI